MDGGGELVFLFQSDRTAHQGHGVRQIEAAEFLVNGVYYFLIEVSSNTSRLARCVHEALGREQVQMLFVRGDGNFRQPAIWLREAFRGTIRALPRYITYLPQNRPLDRTGIPALHDQGNPTTHGVTRVE